LTEGVPIGAAAVLGLADEAANTLAIAAGRHASGEHFRDGAVCEPGGLKSCGGGGKARSASCRASTFKSGPVPSGAAFSFGGHNSSDLPHWFTFKGAGIVGLGRCLKQGLCALARDKAPPSDKHSFQTARLDKFIDL